MIQLPQAERGAVHAGARVLAELDDELVAIVPVTDLRRLETFEAEPEQTKHTEANSRWESEGGSPLDMGTVRTELHRQRESLRDVLARLETLGIDPASVDVPEALELRTGIDGRVSLAVAEPTPTRSNDFGREDDD